MREFTVGIPQVEFLFSPGSGGFPTMVSVTEFGEKKRIPLSFGKSPFSIRSGDETYAPFCDSKTPVARSRAGEALIVEFPRLEWRNEKGTVLPDLYLSLRWEIHPDGVVFCDLFLFYAALRISGLQDFKLSVPVNFGTSDEVKWSVRLPPEKVDATIIQSIPPERYLAREESRHFPGKLFTQAYFNAMRDRGPSFFGEFFLEGGNSLSGRGLPDTDSLVRSTPDGFLLEWNFQKVPCAPRSRPLHWRNRFGFLLRPAPTKRVHRPYSILQYIDNFQRFPDREQVRAIARSGTEVLVMHDCWRLDTQNGGIPYDPVRFRELLRELHAAGIRVLLYVRGNEISVTEDAAPWFDSLLEKDFDGLYIDYGGPSGYFAAPDENHPGGRTEYRRYYLCMKALRERVGKKGILFSHTGTAYSGLASSFFDGYVSGEGERGILIRGWKEHEYFSMSAVSPGNMWTAAFPEYGSMRMTPFLAAAAQAPHLPIGKQIESSSLRHPPVPGISDSAFRDLLHAWRLLGHGTGYDYFTDFNSEGLFGSDSSAAHCVIFAPGRKYGIYLLSNPSANPADGRFATSGFLRKFKVVPVTEKTGLLAPFEVRAALLVPDEAGARRILKRHPLPEVLPTKAGSKYRELLEIQRENRNIRTENCILKVFLPSRITSHEQSLWDDLYNLVFRLRERLKDGSFRTLGYLSRKGLSPELPSEKDRLHPGEISAPVELKKILGGGLHELQIDSEHLGEPFYSFVTADLSCGGQERRIEFMNELEPDRSILHWTIEFGKGK